MENLQNGGVEIAEQSIKYLIHFNNNAYFLHYSEDNMQYSEELTEATTGLPVLDGEEYEAVMNFFAASDPRLF